MATSAASHAIASLPMRNHIKNKINSLVVDSLKHRGYAIVDNVFGEEFSQGFRNEIRHLHQNGIMFSNATHVHLPHVKAPLFIDKRNVMEMELIPDIYSIVPNYLAALDQDDTIMSQLNRHLFHHDDETTSATFGGDNGQLLVHQAIKLQHNSGGCFPLHFDGDARLDPRRVSAVLYLNPDWQPGDGGELKLYPLPFEPVVVEPRMDRLVFFSSTNTLHRVLPFNTQNDVSKERVCLTLWYSASLRAQEEEQRTQLKAPTDPTSVQSILQFLMQPKYRKHIVKLVYAEEWAQSIIESHEPSEGRDVLLANHWQDVEKIRNAFRHYLPVIESYLLLSGADNNKDNISIPDLNLEWI